MTKRPEGDLVMAAVVGGVVVAVIGAFATAIRWVVGGVVKEVRATTNEVIASSRAGERDAVEQVGRLAVEVAGSVAKSVGVGVRGGDDVVVQPEEQDGEKVTLPWFLTGEDGQPFDPTDESLRDPIDWSGAARTALIEIGEDPLHDLGGERMK